MDELNGLLAELKDSLDERMRQISQDVVDRREEYDREFDAVLARFGQRRCPACGGHGASARLDASYMRRFGLREWDGCGRCGGNKDEKGTGYVSLTN